MKITDLKVKIVSSQIDQLIADAERRKRTFDTPEELVQALKDSNRYYRANALASLLTKGNPLPVEYLPAVASQLRDKNVRLRSAALFLLTRFANDKQVVPRLKAHLDDDAQHLRAFATIELAKRGMMPAEKYRREVRGLGHSLDGCYLCGASNAIHVDLTPQSLFDATTPLADADHFAWLLQSPPRVARDSERIQTFVQLGKRVDQDPKSLSVLLNAGSTDSDLARKQIEFVTAVFHNMNPEILPRLHRSLSSKDRRVRSNAALACGALKDPSSIQPLIKALDLESRSCGHRSPRRNAATIDFANAPNSRVPLNAGIPRRKRIRRIERVGSNPGVYTGSCLDRSVVVTLTSHRRPAGIE